MTDNQNVTGSTDKVPEGGGGSLIGGAPRLVVPTVSNTNANPEQQTGIFLIRLYFLSCYLTLLVRRDRAAL
jgi:hypothetical protein